MKGFPRDFHGVVVRGIVEKSLRTPILGKRVQKISPSEVRVHQSELNTLGMEMVLFTPLNLSQTPLQNLTKNTF
ncbi:hypothetical protein LguiA_026333 [Lonicera macranthoides]